MKILTKGRRFKLLLTTTFFWGPDEALPALKEALVGLQGAVSTVKARIKALEDEVTPE